MKSIVAAVWIDTNARLFSLFMICMVCSSHVFADCVTPGSFLSASQLTTILGGNFACGQSTALNPPGWNERHVPGFGGGVLIEQHEGGTTTENVGAWAVTNVSGRGRVTYSYSGGGSSPVYEVSVVGAGNCTAPGCITLPQTYNFCGVGGGAPASLQIQVTTTSISPPISACPSNP